MKAIVDNDIIFKGACFGLLDEFLAGIPADMDSVGVLGAARYVVRRSVKRARLHGDRDVVYGRLERFFSIADELEPSDDEKRLAAEMEYAAQRARLRLDVGESQLCAILLCRAIPRLATGDKNAIIAISEMLKSDLSLAALCRRVICLEQIVAAAIGLGYGDGIRSAVCAEREVDVALRVVMGCAGCNTIASDIIDGLQSYIRDLKRMAPRVLCDG